MGFLKDLRIGKQITLISIIALVGFVAVGGIYVDSSNTQARIRADQLKYTSALLFSEEIKYGFLNARRREKDFLIRLDNKYAEGHGKVVAEVNAGLDRLRPIHTEPEVIALVDKVKAGFGEYVGQFQKVVESWRTVGLTSEDGLKGSLRNSVHEVESKLKEFDEKPLMITMLMMRRHEKDFLLRIDAKYIKEMEERSAKFAGELAASSIPADAKKAITGLMASYQKDFNAVAKILLALEGDVTTLSEIFAGVEPHLKALTEDSRKDFDAATEAAKQNAESTFRTILAAIVAVAIVCIILALVIGRGISAPISSITAVMKRLAGGDLAAAVPARESHNEIGEMAAAVQIFKDNALEVERLRVAHQESEKLAAEKNRAAMMALADNFESSIKGVVSVVSASAAQMQSSSESLSNMSADVSSRTVTVSAATEQASTNVQTVASAAEELSASIREISSQVHQSTRIASTAVSEAQKTNAKVEGLAEAVQKIGEVVNLIADIADQTNLLALNATIEAARAGDAGKGFAVVASEVKNLANQTAKATEEIGSQISDVQKATQDAVSAIGGIGGIIGQISEIASAIAAAVEEQGAATQEISRSVQQAAVGTQEVAANVTEVSAAADATGRSAEEVRKAAASLSHEAETLSGDVDKFIAHIRAH